MNEVTFLRKLQRLLEEGDFVATYKFALLQALADLSVENEPAKRNGTLKLPVRQIAEKFIEYYWRQARPFKGGEVLLANPGKQAAIVNRVAEANSAYRAVLAAARRDRTGWGRLVTSVAQVVRTMPLWKLQVVGGKTEEFLYRRQDYANGCITLRPGVARCFRSFHPFIVNMVRGAWLDHVLGIAGNRPLIGEQDDLSEFLFGSQRRPLHQYRDILRDHQGRECFYCGRKVRNEGALDHFVPWSRYPVDLGHNFVFAHRGCNHAKRDYLAHPRHLGRWKTQNLDDAPALAALFEEATLRHDAERSRKIAAWAYEQAELAKAQVWIQGERFSRLESWWRRSLGLPSTGET